ncbi:asparagine synthase (glutamine-hydrolyzing) [Sunxiuqinia elliptica]
MCGICGILRNSSGAGIAKHIQQINNTLAHRGPDDEGYLLVGSGNTQTFSGKDTPQTVLESNCIYCPGSRIESSTVNGYLALGHRRLSILDNSANGHQPMCSEDQKTWIIHNGEIYNYIELRKELEKFGYTFKSGTDTEVILKAYQHWGKSCVEHFNGMWAFVIYDCEKHLLFGSRDRLGVKPLYYYKDQSCFVFASEQKGLAKSELVKTEMNSRAVFDYLVLSHGQPEAEGFFKNIIELEAGSIFELELQSFRFSTYSYFSANNIRELKEPIIELDAIDNLYSRLNKAITIRTRADVEVGACLSGGVDSSFIVMILDKYFKEQNKAYKPKVFTAAYPGFDVDEEKWARRVVESANVDWYVTYPEGADLLSDLHQMIYAADSPMLSTSTYAQYRVMKLAKETEIKVLLDGQGADELFAGYFHLDCIYYNELAKRFRLHQLLEELKAKDGVWPNVKRWMTADLRYLTQNLSPGLVRFFYEQSVFELKYIRPELKRNYHNRFGQLNFPFGAELNDTLKRYSSGEKLQSMLRLEDRMSMNFSIESRTPFADDLDLISYSLSLPSRLKIKNGVNKHIFRQAGKSILPDAIFARKDKIGFQTPEQSWLKVLKGEILDLLDSNIDDVVDLDLLKVDLEKLIESPTSAINSRLLRFVFLSQWRKVYNL